MIDLPAPQAPDSAPAPRALRDDALAEYCQLLFSSFVRSDQRRWGEVYVRGLLGAPGRKTLAGISEHVLGVRTIQPLQQFLNQSPWDHVAVRRSLARTACAQLRPQAWAVDDVVFPKHGRHSAGVARQFVAHEGRMLNCQLGVAVSAVGDGAALPLDWRMVLPARWDHDHELRTKAHLPAEVRHRPRWQHVLGLVDELIEDWHLPPAPVLVDGRHEPDLEPLLRGLESRGLGYVVEVSPTAAVRQAGAAGPAPGGAARAAAVARAGYAGAIDPGRRAVLDRAPGPGAPRLLTAAQCVKMAAYRCERTTLAWTDGTELGPRRSQFLVAPVPGLPAAERDERLRASGRARRVVAEWPVGLARPRTYWVTNLPGSLAQLVALGRLRAHSGRALAALRADLGLADFEGRSFRGWHHHVTLVSAAHGFRALAELAARRAQQQYAPAVPAGRHLLPAQSRHPAAGGDYAARAAAGRFEQRDHAAPARPARAGRRPIALAPAAAAARGHTGPAPGPGSLATRSSEG